jgi:hypothetical protein
VADPLVPISWGELIDKITILRLKRARLHDAAAVADVARELAALEAIVAGLDPTPPELPALTAALASVNARLWEIEDDIRAHEAAQRFDAGFIALARQVYQQNDERGRLKRAINALLGSGFVEHKQYTAY